MEVIKTNRNEIEIMGVLLPEFLENHEGYKETKITWLSANVMVLSNNDIPISEDIALALGVSCDELIKRKDV